MPFAIKKGTSVDNDTQARVIRELVKGEYRSAYGVFNKTTSKDLQEVVKEYAGLLNKYSNYYEKNKKVKRLINKFISDAGLASQGKTFKFPTKKLQIKFEEPNTQTVEENPEEVEVEISTQPDATAGFRETPIPVIKPEVNPRVAAAATTTAEESVKTAAEADAKIIRTDKKMDQGVQKIGLLGPHSKNTTQADIVAAIGANPEDQMRDFNNWFIFDLPVDATGVGSANINPLVKQNEILEDLNGEGDLFKVSTEPYLLTEGPMRIKKFYGEHPNLLRASFAADIKRRTIEENEAEFLAQFDSGANGLFPQDQTTKEKNNFRNVVQVPAGSWMSEDEYPLTNPFPTSLFVKDEILTNKNYYPDGNASY
jgi:hypothetical protein